MLHVLQGRSVPVNILCKMSVKGDGIAPSRQTAVLGQPLGSGNSPEIGRPQTTSSPMLAKMKLKLACTCINYKFTSETKATKTQTTFKNLVRYLSLSTNLATRAAQQVECSNSTKYIGKPQQLCCCTTKSLNVSQM